MIKIPGRFSDQTITKVFALLYVMCKVLGTGYDVQRRGCGDCP